MSHLLFPFLSSWLYVLGVLFLKRASDLKVGVWRNAFVCNVIVAASFLFLLPQGGIFHLELWYQPILVGFLFLSGQVFTFLSLEGGHVSVVTPAMGTKTVLVGWFSLWLIGTDLSWQLWCSAILSSVAVLALNRDSQRTPVEGLGKALFLALCAAASYALFDVLVQKWTPHWGRGVFLPLSFAVVALSSFAFLPFFSPSVNGSTRKAMPWLLIGSVTIAVQAMVLISAIAKYGDATAMNVVYSGRGLWSVLAVMFIGKWFHNVERKLPRRVLAWRFVGAILMLAAILITFYHPSAANEKALPRVEGAPQKSEQLR